VRPFLRHDYLKVTAIVESLRSGSKTGLTSEKAAVALGKYAHVVPNASVWGLRINDVQRDKNIRIRIYYRPLRKTEFVVPKSVNDTVTNILRMTFGGRFDALIS
jgi:hypothetical protein